MSGAIPAAFALPHVAPEFFESLTPEEQLVIPYMFDLWLRPKQRITDYDWRYLGFISGRGWGKSLAIAVEFNRRVQAGEARAPALMAPTDDRVDEVQISFLIATAPPWFRPKRYRGGIIWPNGVFAEAFTPEAPGRSRSGNFDLVWLCEIVDWQSSTRKEAFDNLTTACRIGRAQVMWDTTSKGKNDVIQHLEAVNALDPYTYPIQRGAMFDNPLLSKKYLKAECAKYSGREYDEEILGLTFSEAAGALWEQAWLDDHRVYMRPSNPELTIIGVDPALSAHKSADEVGIVRTSRDRDGDVYIEEDLSDKLKPEQWGDIVVDQCVNHGAAGVVIERNHLGDNATFVIKSRAANKGYKVRLLPRWGTKDAKSFPSRTPGVIYVREAVAASSKMSRASGPAAETEAGRVHCVGTLSELELEFTTYESGKDRSPNRYDAAVYSIIELRGLWEEVESDPVADTHEAANAYEVLRENLRRMGPRRIGL